MARTKTCPECGDDVSPEFRPFCSRRCADVDLGRWLTGAYTIAATDEDDGNADETGVARPAAANKH